MYLYIYQFKYYFKFQVLVGSWGFRMVYFLDTMPTIGNKSQVPSDLHMMQHVYRSKIYEMNTKSISNTDTVLTVQQHSHYSCLEGITCMKTIANPKIAQSHHYRKDCHTRKLKDHRCAKSQESSVKDTRVLRHLKTVKQNTDIALKNIIFE